MERPRRWDKTLGSLDSSPLSEFGSGFSIHSQAFWSLQPHRWSKQEDLVKEETLTLVGKTEMRAATMIRRLCVAHRWVLFDPYVLKIGNFHEDVWISGFAWKVEPSSNFRFTLHHSCPSRDRINASLHHVPLSYAWPSLLRSFTCQALLSKHYRIGKDCAGLQTQGGHD